MAGTRWAGGVSGGRSRGATPPRPATGRLAPALLAVFVFVAAACVARSQVAAPPAQPVPTDKGSARIAPSVPTAAVAPAATTAPTETPAATGLAAVVEQVQQLLTQPPPTPAPQRPATGVIVQREHVRLATKRDVDEVSDRFYVYDNALPAQYAVDWYRLRITSSFVTPDGQEMPIETAAQMFVPRTDQPAEFPLFVFGPGTTGLVGDCAASREQPTERSWGDFQAYLMSYAAQGYVTVMPDYEGFDGGSGIHHYYVAELEARVLLDAARAGLRFFKGQPGADLPTKARAANAIFFAGYSQGGHAALAARDAASRYAPDLHVAGAIGYGPRGDVQTLLAEMPGLAPYLLYAYGDYYGHDKVDAGRVLLPQLSGTLERDAKRLCIDEVLDYYGYDPRVVFQPKFADALAHDRLGEEYAPLKELLDRNNVGVTPGGPPVLVVQGLADTVVEPATQRAFVRRLCGSDVKVTLIAYEGIPHVLTRQVSIDDTVAWMQAVQQGKPSQVACGKA